MTTGVESAQALTMRRLRPMLGNKTHSTNWHYEIMSRRVVVLQVLYMVSRVV